MTTPLMCTTEHPKPVPAVAIASPNEDPWPVCVECEKWVRDPRNGFDVQPLLLLPESSAQGVLMAES